MSITWNWNPRRVCFVDFETASLVNLKKAGSHSYVRDPSTRLMSAVWILDDKTRVVWVPRVPTGYEFASDCEFYTGDTVPPRVVQLSRDFTWVAHNAEGFDAQLWDAKYPDVPVEWCDTAILCRVLGLPGSLAGATKALNLPGKDDAGHKIMMLMTKRPEAVGTGPLWDKLLRYNVQDVSSLASLWDAVSSAPQRDEIALHSEVNERGVAVDRAFAASLHATWVATKVTARDEIAEATGGKLTAKKASSGPATHKWLESQGISLKNLRREFVQQVLDDPESLLQGDDATLALVAHVLRLRSDVVRAGEGKVARLVGTLDADERLRRMMVYAGAATGRFSSRVVQVHNLPKGVGKLDIEALTSRPLTPRIVLDLSAATGISAADIMASLVRPCFVAREGKTLCISDFASIEARGLAWCAGEESLLRTFASGGDVYCDMASGLYGRDITEADVKERQVGKTVILGAGYQMGPDNFGFVCKNAKIDLVAAGVTAEQCIKSYREKYPAIPKLWKGLGDAVTEVVRTAGTRQGGRVTLSMRGLNLVITLPSGRDIIYRDARIEKKVPRWAVLKGRLDIPPCDCVVYTHPHGYPKDLYGGLLTENCLAADTRVITDRGIIPITRVTPLHRVWDGESWVSNGGVICQGIKEVGTWLGVSSTGDHLISDGTCWRSAMLSDGPYLQRCLEFGRGSDASVSLATGEIVTRTAGTQSSWNARAVLAEPSTSERYFANGIELAMLARLKLDHAVTIKDARSKTGDSGTCGRIDIRVSCRGATTPRVELTTTTAGVESRCTESGEVIARHFTDTPSRSGDGMTPLSISTDATMTGTTSRVTSDLCQEPSTQITDDLVFGFDTWAVLTRPLSSVMRSVLRGVATPSPTTWTEEEVSRGLWQSTGRREAVYDLLNCGPHSRFAIMTDAGPVVVHNCVQAICRDLLVNAMLRYEAERPGEIVLHVHDEIVAESADAATSLATLSRIMSTPPAWAAGFPIEVKSYTGPRYVKSPFRDATLAHYREGVQV